MTPTSEDRRDVAERLRHEADGFRRLENELGQLTIDLGEVTAVFQDVAHFAGLDGTVRTCVLLDRLADLIEPARLTTTIRVIRGDENAAGDICCSCESCNGGWHWSMYDAAPRFCPKCGARVVNCDD